MADGVVIVTDIGTIVVDLIADPGLTPPNEAWFAQMDDGQRCIQFIQVVDPSAVAAYLDFAAAWWWFTAGMFAAFLLVALFGRKDRG